MDNTDSNSDIDNVEPENEFQFETDHLALRGNDDYCRLLKYIVSLEMKKVKALKDIDDLAEAQNKALQDPIQFLKNLQDGLITFPTKQSIPEVPHVDLTKYGVDNLSDTESINKDLALMKHDTDEMKVRGRTFTESKPETFNQLWSVEEQRRLEELLVIYPEEPIEAKRFKKIAAALGTRTPVQIMSRVQKYFAKLAKAGLPIPGRMPKKISKQDKNKSYHSFYVKKSTFFPGLHVPVKMEDLCDKTDKGVSMCFVESKSSNEAAIELLKTAKEQRLLDLKNPIWHTDVLCVGCQKTSFLGARWTDNAGTDYCTDCIVKLLPNEKLIPVRKT